MVLNETGQNSRLYGMCNKCDDHLWPRLSNFHRSGYTKLERKKTKHYFKSDPVIQTACQKEAYPESFIDHKPNGSMICQPGPKVIMTFYERSLMFCSLPDLMFIIYVQFIHIVYHGKTGISGIYTYISALYARIRSHKSCQIPQTHIRAVPDSIKFPVCE